MSYIVLKHAYHQWNFKAIFYRPKQPIQKSNHLLVLKSEWHLIGAILSINFFGKICSFLKTSYKNENLLSIFICQYSVYTSG